MASPDLRRRAVLLPRTPVGRRARLSDQGAIRFVVLSTTAFVLTTLCGVVGADLGPATGAVLLATCAGCVELPVGWAVAAGACSWAYLTGFVANAGGQLTFSGPDGLRAAVFLGLTAATALLAGSARQHDAAA